MVICFPGAFLIIILEAHRISYLWDIEIGNGEVRENLREIGKERERDKNIDYEKTKKN